MRDRRVAVAIGRRARLELVFRVAGGRTVLAHAYAEPPLRVSRPLPWQDGAHVILASSAPGLFGGDRFASRVIVERGARVSLSSQSALQVHPSAPCQAARIVSVFEVDDGAELLCNWDPLIPFARSQLSQKITMRLASTARLFWSDALMTGRCGRGEHWQFESLAHALRIVRGPSTEYLDRYRIEPRADPVARPWVGGHACYFGTIVATGWPVPDGAAERLHHACGRLDGLAAAVDRLGPELLLARCAATSGPAFHHARSLVRESLTRPSGP